MSDSSVNLQTYAVEFYQGLRHRVSELTSDRLEEVGFIRFAARRDSHA